MEGDKDNDGYLSENELPERMRAMISRADTDGDKKLSREELTVESFREAMGDREWRSDKAVDLLDEHPSSYGDIDVVMSDQADLVRPIHTLRQILNYKGL